MTRRVIINTIATFDGSVIATVEALKNIKNIRIVLRKQPTQWYFTLMTELEDIDTLKDVYFKLTIKMDILDILEFLSIGIGNKELTSLTLDLSQAEQVTQSIAILLEKCICNDLSRLKLSLSNADDNSLLLISKTLYKMKNLSSFDFNIKFQNNLNQNIIFKALSCQTNLKKLKYDLNNALFSEPNSQKHTIFLDQCEKLKLSINSFFYLHPQNNMERLKQLQLILDPTSQLVFDEFIKFHLPYLQTLDYLKMDLRIIDQKTLELIVIILMRQQRIQKLSIRNYFPDITNIRDIFQLLQYNKSLTSFSFINNKLCTNKVTINYQDFQHFKGIKHLQLQLGLFQYIELKYFIKCLQQLDNLITLRVYYQYEDEVFQLLKLKRLVILKNF